MSLKNFTSCQCIHAFQGSGFTNSYGSVGNVSPPTLTSNDINNDVQLHHDMVIIYRTSLMRVSADNVSGSQGKVQLACIE